MMPPDHPRPLGVLLLLSLALSSCRTATPSGSDLLPVRLATPVEGDRALAERIRIIDPRIVEQGLEAELNVALELVVGDDETILYHVDWYDVLGNPIEQRPQTWTPVNLARERQVIVRSPAPSDRARSFRLRFQTAGALR